MGTDTVVRISTSYHTPPPFPPHRFFYNQLINLFSIFWQVEASTAEGERSLLVKIFELQSR